MAEDNESGEKKEHSKHSKFDHHVNNMRNNPWIPATIVLGIVCIVLIAFLAAGSSGGVSSKVVESNIVTFANAQGVNASVVSVAREGTLYKAVVSVQGQESPLYVTTDGKFLITNTIPLVESTPSASDSGNDQPSTPAVVPKSDKPSVELFVMSYCPFGTQAEKGLIPVLSLLNNKINGTIRFVHYTMHGAKEDTENSRQLCIREEQGTKFNKYLMCILNSTDSSNPADVNACMQKNGIDATKVNDCITNRAAKYYAADSALSNEYGVQGSPTLIINGVEASSGRDSASYLKTICAAFNNAPAECNTQLSSASPSAGFGLGTADSANAAQCGA